LCSRECREVVFEQRGGSVIYSGGLTGDGREVAGVKFGEGRVRFGWTRRDDERGGSEGKCRLETRWNPCFFPYYL